VGNTQRSARKSASPKRTDESTHAQAILARLLGSLEEATEMAQQATVHINQTTHVCEIRMRGHRQSIVGKGATAEEAAKQAVVEIGHLITGQIERAHVPRSAEPKETRTIGTYGPNPLWEAVNAYSGFGKVSQVEKCRRLLKEGLKMMDRRLDSERSNDVLESVLHAVDVFNTGEKRQVSVRVDPSLFRHAVVTAHEYDRSLSALAVGWIAMALRHHQDP
jgi:hypothetical protein